MIQTSSMLCQLCFLSCIMIVFTQIGHKVKTRCRQRIKHGMTNTFLYGVLSCVEQGRCPVKVFHFYVVSALQFIVFVFYFWLIRAVRSSYVHQQHFRPRSLAFSCHLPFLQFFSRTGSEFKVKSLRDFAADPHSKIKGVFPPELFWWWQVSPLCNLPVLI